MSKILFIGDSHLQINRFELAKQFLEWVNNVVLDIKPDLVVNLGDTFDTHAVLRSEILTEFKKHVKTVTSSGVGYFYVLGNHDMYRSKDARYHALQTLEIEIKVGDIVHVKDERHLDVANHFDLLTKGKVIQIRENGLIEIEGNTSKSGKINTGYFKREDIYLFHVIDTIQDLFGMTFVPYQHDPSKFPKKTLPICVAHQTFIGADYGSITTKDGVDAASIEGCELVISGHIHKRHSIPPRDGRGASVTYPGSPFSQSVEDIDQVKGLMLFDTETFKEEFIECPLPKWRGLRYDIDQQFGIDLLYTDLQERLSATKDHWTIELTGSKAELTSYLNSDRHRSLISGIDVNIKPNYTDKEKRKLRIEVRSMDNIVSDYIVKVYSGSLDKDLLQAKALELIKQSNTGIITTVGTSTGVNDGSEAS